MQVYDRKANMKAAMRRLMVGFIISLGVLVVGTIIYIYAKAPKTSALADSEFFNEEKVYAEAQAVVDLITGDDFAAVREKYCNAEMAAKMTDSALEEAKDSVSENWGAYVENVSSEGYEVRQKGDTYAMVRLKTSYENVTVTYTIMFDIDMKLAGLAVE